MLNNIMEKLNQFEKEFSQLSRHHSKLVNFVLPELKKISNSNILEFGVSNDAMSTELFLNHSKQHNCKLFSVDIVDYKTKFKDKNWKFILSRDDNYKFVKEKIPDEFELILLDTIHEAKHVENIIYNYYEKLKKNSCFFIDDINWMPYVQNSEKDHFYNEINNFETFEKLLEIHFNNRNNIFVEFSFHGTGMCKIKKLNQNPLNSPKKINTRKDTFKNLIRKFYKG